MWSYVSRPKAEAQNEGKHQLLEQVHGGAEKHTSNRAVIETDIHLNQSTMLLTEILGCLYATVKSWVLRVSFINIPERIFLWFRCRASS